MMDKRDLLLEIGVEEIPARFLPPAIRQLNSLAAEALAGAGLPYDMLHIYATPRRLTLLAEGLVTVQADSVTEAKGPSVAAAYDAEGNPSRALQGFCKGQGVSEAELQQKEVGGNLYVFAVKQVKGQSAAAILPRLLTDIIHKIYFPKPMRWGYEEMRFARPIHWLVALLGEDVLPLSLAGIEADRFTRGHRTLGSQQIKVSRPGHYLQLLRENYVICDQQERRDMVWRQILEVAASLNGQVREDEELLEEVVFLLEYPTALAGSFEEKYLDLPAELIITPMREHQRYFPVYKKDGGLLNKFITVRNGDSRFLDVVAAGNEKVIRPRLADAAFFWQEDLRRPLEHLAGRLREIVFHEKLGDMEQKTRRLMELSLYIGGLLGYSPQELKQTERAAYLCKADLLSHAVYEFPELQGVMGEYYAQAAGEDEAVAKAIREHYLPRFAGDDVPLSRPGIAVALADRIDSLAGFFAAGLIPSGSQDPYALRRAAAGCVQIVARHGLFLPGRELTQKAFDLLRPHMTESTDVDLMEKIGQLLAFLCQRIATALSEEGLPYDVIQAMENQRGGNIWETMLKARALHEYRGLPGFGILLTGFTRAANLLRSAAQKGDIEGADALPAPKEELLQDAAEKQLYEYIKEIRGLVNDDLRERFYKKALEHLAGLSGYIDAFFAAVMVMDQNREIRHNRLALLKQIVALGEEMGDLSKINA
ncbi:MAG: glycine--tRNA ligase subunit beta [Clostridiales bacterium]|nr:glycine--tRNA ligase subunit beta [Clostridiales bacterium]